MAKAPQKRGKTPSGRPIGLRFGEGQPRNLGGRPKGLMQAVRAQTKDGKELVNFALDVLRGKSLGKFKRKLFDQETEVEVFPETRDRLEALKWLSDRGFGKPVQEVAATGPGLLGLVVLPSEED